MLGEWTLVWTGTAILEFILEVLFHSSLQAILLCFSQAESQDILD